MSHGATTRTAITHIAIQEALNDEVVDWMEHATDRAGKVPGEPGQPIDLLGAFTIREDVPTFFLRVRWLRSTSMISFRTWDRRLHSRESAIARGRRIYVGTSGLGTRRDETTCQKN